jgi:hypothetical protein
LPSLDPAATGPAVALNVENAWQFSKVYADQADADGNPTEAWVQWARQGFADPKPHRFPKGRGAIPLYSYGGATAPSPCHRWGYIEARFRIYAPLYAQLVQQTDAYQELQRRLAKHGALTLLDFDGWDHRALNLDLEDVIYYPRKKMGHAFVLAMCLLKKLVWEQPYDPARIDVVCAKAAGHR